MKKTVKVILISLGALVVIVLGVTIWYTKFYHQAGRAKNASDALAVVSASTTTAAGAAPTTAGAGGSSPATTTAATTGATASGNVDGTWKVAGGSSVDYRVKEVINGFDKVAVGKSSAITGSITISGTTVNAGELSVDMTTFKSDESRRDSQFNGRIMAVAQFPTATFKLTSPISFVAIPAEGTTEQATATGDLTLHGVTKSVTFTVNAAYGNGKIGVQGSIPISFADYGIANPSFGTITTEDHGLLEFVLAFGK